MTKTPYERFIEAIKEAGGNVDSLSIKYNQPISEGFFKSYLARGKALYKEKYSAIDID